MFDDVKELKIGNDKVSILKIGDDIVYPKGLILYDFMQTDDNAFIQTDFIGTLKSKIESKFEYTWKSDTYIIASRDNINSSGNGRFIAFARSNNGVYYGYNNYNFAVNIVEPNTIVNLKADFKNKHIYINDVDTGMPTYSAFNNVAKLQIPFRYPNNTTSKVSYGNGTIKLYWLKCYEDDKLVNNFIPCTYNGEAGLFDTVQNKFYGNKGTGTLTVGKI